MGNTNKSYSKHQQEIILYLYAADSPRTAHTIAKDLRMFPNKTQIARDCKALEKEGSIKYVNSECKRCGMKILPECNKQPYTKRCKVCELGHMTRPGYEINKDYPIYKFIDNSPLSLLIKVGGDDFKAFYNLMFNNTKKKTPRTIEEDQAENEKLLKNIADKFIVNGEKGLKQLDKIDNFSSKALIDITKKD